MTTPRFSLVVPVYQNAESIPALVKRLDELSRYFGGDFEAVLVVDGSPDASASLLRHGLATCACRATLVTLSRNFGSFAAIQTGLGVARGDFHCVMAADLQEPAAFVIDAFEELARGTSDIAVGVRVSRRDTRAVSVTSGLFWRAYRRLVNPAIPSGGVDVFACTQEVSRHLANFSEAHSSLVGLLFWVGYRRCEIPYEREERHSGRSAWTLRRRVRYLLDSVFAFTDKPILLLQLLGLVGVVLSFLVAVVVLAGWIFNFIDAPGYTPLMLVVTGSTSALLLGLGIVGSYTWRAYENTKSRPLTIVSSMESFE